MRITDHHEQIVTDTIVTSRATVDDDIDHQVFMVQAATPAGPQLVVAVVLSVRGIALTDRITAGPILSPLFHKRAELEQLVRNAIAQLAAAKARQVQQGLTRPKS